MAFFITSCMPEAIVKTKDNYSLLCLYKFVYLSVVEQWSTLFPVGRDMDNCK